MEYNWQSMYHVQVKLSHLDGNTKQRDNVSGKQLLFHVINDSDAVNRVKIKKMRGNAGLPRMIIYISLLSGMLKPP